MKRKFFKRAAMVVLLCIAIMIGSAFLLMETASASEGGQGVSSGAIEAPAPASNLSIGITLSVGWAADSAAVQFCITDETGNGFALVQVKTGENGHWRDVGNDLKQRDNFWRGEMEVSENCTVYVSAQGHDGKFYEKSRYIGCFDRTAPALRAAADGRMLRVEAKDDLSGVAAVYIDGKKYVDLDNGTLDVALRDLQGDYEQIFVQAMDAAGNRSAIVQVKNPGYMAEDAGEKSAASQTQPPAVATTVPETITALPAAAATVTPTTPLPSAAAGTVAARAAQTATPTSDAEKPFAGTDSTKPSASASSDPDGEPDTTPRNPVPFTPDGQASVVDNATGEDGKAFYTIQTPDGNVFYLVIDSQRGAENAYFLNAVTEADLMALAATEDDAPQADAVPDPEPACICEEQCAPGEVNTSCPVCILARKDCIGKAPVADIEEDADTGAGKKRTGGGAGTLAFVFLVMLTAGGAGYYFKIYKPKKELDDAEDFDDLIGGDDEEETVGEDEEGTGPEEVLQSACAEPDEPEYPDGYV